MKKLFRWLRRAEEVAVGIGFMFLILFVFVSALLRAFRFSMSWTIDMAMLLLAWTAFLGADIAWRDGQIIGVDLVTRTLPRKLQQYIKLVVYLIILVVLGMMFYYGIRLAWTERVRTYQSMPIPYALVTFSLIIASFSMFFSTIQKIQGAFLELREKETPPDKDEGEKHLGVEP